MSGKKPPLSRPIRKPRARVDLDSDERTQEVEKLHHVDDKKLTVTETCLHEGPNSKSYEGTYDSRRACIKRFPAAQKYYFEREAIILSQLKHENVVQFIGIRRHNDEDYYDIVTEFLGGGTLKALLIDFHSSPVPLPIRKALGYALDIARAMEYVHQKKFVHRDVKPGNVVLTEQKDQAVVINFGQAIKDNINGLKGAAGINIWMAPEMMPTGKREPYDRKVDMYSFSIVLWELVTSKIPYYEHYKSIQEIEEDIRTHNIRPRLKDVKIPEVAALLPSCWAAEAATRPEFSEIVTRLEEILHKLDPRLPSAPKTMSGSGEARQPSGPANNQVKIDPGQASTSGTPEEDEVANLPQIDPAGLILKKGSIHKGPNAKSYKGTYFSNPVLVKIYPEAYEEYFVDEAIILSKLNHENIVQLVGVCRSEDGYLIVTKFLQGRTLKDLLESSRWGWEAALPLPRAIGYALDIARAMDYVHQQKYIHRDLNAGNVILTGLQDRAVLIDFGNSIKEDLTGMPGVAETPFWTAPEMMSEYYDMLHYDHKVDVFSFSIVLWELITCKFPYQEQSISMDEILDGIKTHKIRPSLEGIQTPEKLETLLKSCWAPEATDRPEFSEITTKLEELQQTLHSTDTTVPRTTTKELPGDDQGGDASGSDTDSESWFRSFQTLFHEEP